MRIMKTIARKKRKMTVSLKELLNNKLSLVQVRKPLSENCSHPEQKSKRTIIAEIKFYKIRSFTFFN